MSVDVARRAVDLGGVDHDGVRAGPDGLGEGRQKVFAQVVLRNPRGRSVAPAQREAVAHVVLQAHGDVIGRRNVFALDAAHEGRAHDFGEVRVFAERLVEARPQRLTTDVEHG